MLVCGFVYLGEVVVDVERRQLSEVSIKAQCHEETCILISQLWTLWLVVGYPGWVHLNTDRKKDTCICTRQRTGCLLQRSMKVYGCFTLTCEAGAILSPAATPLWKLGQLVMLGGTSMFPLFRSTMVFLGGARPGVEIQKHMNGCRNKHRKNSEPMKQT